MRLAERLERVPDRVAGWLGGRSPHPLPFKLTQRRIYVLPSGAGLAFALALLVLLVGAINYGLSLGHALVFLLFGIGVAATFQGFRNLLGLRVAALRIDPVFAGEPAELHVLLENSSSHRRAAVRLKCGRSETRSDLQAASTASIVLDVPTTQRGWMKIEHIRIATTWPLGLVRVWSVLRPELACLVYATPEPKPPPLPSGSATRPDGALVQRSGDDDFAGLRPHRITDSPRHVAWKIAASGGPLLTKEFAAQEGVSLLLDWNSLHGLDDDARAARLSAWVLAAEGRKLRYALRTPEGTLEADCGPHHLRNCLSRLALARSPDESR